MAFEYTKLKFATFSSHI